MDPLSVMDPNFGGLTGPGKQTNSSDPVSVGSRIFVGNLNTFQIPKNEIEAIFMNYGPVVGLSIHKGYAFVQYTIRDHAQAAVIGERGKTYHGSTLDVKMAAEGKMGVKKQHSNRQPGVGINTPVLVKPAQKRPRIDPSGPQTRNLVSLTGSTDDDNTASNRNSTGSNCSQSASKRMAITAPSESNSSNIRSATSKPTTENVIEKVFSYPDTLICGICKSQFDNVTELVYHKRKTCKLVVCCTCGKSKNAATDTEEPLFLTCATCMLNFENAWTLVEHCQQAHHFQVYLPKVTDRETQDVCVGTESVLKNDESDDIRLGSPSDITENDELEFKYEHNEVQNIDS